MIANRQFPYFLKYKLNYSYNLGILLNLIRKNGYHIDRLAFRALSHNSIEIRGDDHEVKLVCVGIDELNFTKPVRLKEFIEKAKLVFRLRPCYPETGLQIGRLLKYHNHHSDFIVITEKPMLVYNGISNKTNYFRLFVDDSRNKIISCTSAEPHRLIKNEKLVFQVNGNFI